MSEHKAKVRFAAEVWEKIEWFTYHFDTEIGALGKVKIKTDKETGEKYYYVYKLLFPQQRVSGATVHFTAEDWIPLVKEHGFKGLSDVMFYWHRHPGGSAHSQTDDVDTFETFMSKEANRKQFIFLQTAVDGSNVWNSEARIDIRLPIRHTILDKDIELEVDENPEEVRIREECKAISDSCIIKEAPMTCTTTHKNGCTYKSYKQDVYKANYGSDEEDTEEDMFGIDYSGNKMDNDYLDTYATTIFEKVSIDFKDGQATILAGKNFGLLLEKALEQKDGKVTKFVRTHTISASKSEGLKKYQLQPKAKKYKEFREALTNGYKTYCRTLLVEIKKDYLKEDLEKKTLNEPREIDLKDKNNLLSIKGKNDVAEALYLIDAVCFVDWENVNKAMVYDFEYSTNLGTLYRDGAQEYLSVVGHDLILLLKEQQIIDDKTCEEE